MAWEKDGKKLKELIRLGGLQSKSHPSQVKKGLGVGSRVKPGYARAFGFESVDALEDAAWEWWRTEGRPKSGGDDSHLEKAISMAVGLGQATEPELRAIIAAHGGPAAFRSDSDGAAWDRVIKVIDEHRQAEKAEAIDQKETRDYHRKAQAARKESEEVARTIQQKRPKTKKAG